MTSSQALRAENVPYVVAPYEADAQMAFLEATGVVNAILTEDSDLLVFGARTVLLKLDVPSASVTSISHTDLGTALPGWTHTRFREMAILSGCDYLPSLSGVGLKTARTWLSAHGSVEKALSVARLTGKTRVTPGYLQLFRRAEAVFLYQRVFDPSSNEIVHLSSPPAGYVFDDDTNAYIGRYVRRSSPTASLISN
jgi:exonuclease-1